MFKFLLESECIEPIQKSLTNEEGKIAIELAEECQEIIELLQWCLPIAYIFNSKANIKPKSSWPILIS